MSYRLFVCILPPPDLAEHLAALPELLAAPGVDLGRAIEASKLHLTLAFLGDRHKKELTGIHESVERSVSGLRQFSLHPQLLMTLPRRQTPRLLAATTDEQPTLMEIHRRLVTRLIRPIAREKRTTPYLPHFTLTRCEPGQSMPDANLALPDSHKPAIAVSSIALMHSVATQFGARYELVRDFPLGA